MTLEVIRCYWYWIPPATIHDQSS